LNAGLDRCVDLRPQREKYSPFPWGIYTPLTKISQDPNAIDALCGVNGVGLFMASESDTPSEASAEGKPKAARGKLMIIIIAAVLLLGGGGGAYFFLFASKPAPKEEHAEQEKKNRVFLDIKDMLIGMNGDSAQASSDHPRFIKLHIALEIADSKQLPLIQALQPRIEDIFQVYLRELRPSDLQGSSSIFRLKDELLKRVNLAVFPNRIDAVLFKELLIQ
jgi:flagellar FliL protein